MSNHVLVRNAPARSLGPLDRSFYGEPPAGASALRSALTALSDASNTSTFRRLTGWDHDPMRRLLYLHRSAFEAEAQGRERTADYFWIEAHHRLAALWGKPRVWSHAAQSLGAAFAGDGAELRMIVAREIFLDVHLAFANGALRATGGSRKRLDFHARKIESILMLDESIADSRTALLPAIEAELESHRSEPEKSIARLRALKLPSVRAATAMQLAELIFERATILLNGSNAEIGTKRLREGIEDLEALRRGNPGLYSAYDMLAQLHLVNAVRLGNNRDVADALVEAERALAFKPDFDPAATVVQQLGDAMRALQAQIQGVEQELRYSSGKTLNAEGFRLLSQAQRGFGPVDAFRNSGKIEALRKDRDVASATDLWTQVVGYREERPRDEQLLAFRSVVTELYVSDEDDASRLRESYEQRKDVPASVAQLVAEFVLRRRRENADGSVEATAEPTAVVELWIDPMPPASGDPEPYAHWWFGSQDKALRALAVASLVCAVSVGTMTVLETSRQSARHEAWTTFKTSSNDGDAIAAAERYLAIPPPMFGSDARRRTIRSEYARAFIGWFSALPDPGSPEALAHIRTYRNFSMPEGSP